jgi:hypothetical protein
VYYLPRSLGSQLLSALPPPVLGACASPGLGRGATRGLARQVQRRRQNVLRLPIIIEELFVVVEGVYIHQGAREPQSITPEGRGGRGLITEAIRIAFVVHAVEAVGADHGICGRGVFFVCFSPGGLLHKQGPRGARIWGAPLPHSHNALVATPCSVACPPARGPSGEPGDSPQHQGPTSVQ